MNIFNHKLYLPLQSYIPIVSSSAPFQGTHSSQSILLLKVFCWWASCRVCGRPKRARD